MRKIAVKAGQATATSTRTENVVKFGRVVFETDRQCIAHCSLAAEGECACAAHAADECMRRRAKGDKTAMRPFAK